MCNRSPRRIDRRTLLHLTVVAAVFPGISRAVSAPAYPLRPVRIIVGFPSGGGGDIAARLIGQYLSDRLGQPFVVENRPGGGTNIATEVVVKSSPDGYTLLLFDAASAVNATLYEKLNFNFVRDIAPIAGIATVPNVMLVHPSFPAKTVPEFIAHAKAHPGKINMASAGNGTPAHLTGELFKMAAAVDLVHVPYRGGAPAMTDLLAGQVQVYFGTTTGSVEYVRAGTLRALAVTGTTRSELLPDVPTMGEFIPGFETSQWYGIGAPRDTPADIVETLNKEINAALADPKLKARIADLGGKILTGSATELGKLIAEETEKWGRVIRAANIKA